MRYGWSSVIGFLNVTFCLAIQLETSVPKVEPLSAKVSATSLLSEDTSEDELSDISDGEGFCYPSEDASKKYIKRTLFATKNERVRLLFTNTDKVC